jgi:biopolymer transport protein ExbD/biopolymer transport protein TolR
MGLSVGGGRRGILSDVNIVPLIDILLVLLVIFMIIPHHQQGLDASLPQQSTKPDVGPPPDVVVVQVLADGSLRINQDSVAWDDLEGRLKQVFQLSARPMAFVRGDAPVEFAVVARVIDSMRGAGIVTVGLLTPELEKVHGTR